MLSKKIKEAAVVVAAVAYALAGIVLGVTGNLTEAALRILVVVGFVLTFVILRMLRNQQT